MLAICICAIIILAGYAIGVTCETYKSKPSYGSAEYTSTQISLPIITAIAAAVVMLAANFGKIEISLIQCILISLVLIAGGIVHTVVEYQRYPDYKHYLSISSMFFNLLAIVIALIFSVN